MSEPGASRLREMLSRNHAIAESLTQPEFPLVEFEQLQSWQRERIARSFADLADRKSDRPAVHFFLTELYGGLDFRERDEDIGKVMPVMIRFLPDRTLGTMSEAFELQAISLRYDMGMAEWMRHRGLSTLDMSSYCSVYRNCSDRAGRERQIQLIRKLGYDLKGLVRWPMVNTLVRLLRGPAHAAGFGKLQAFLEQGLSAFRSLEDPAYFVDTIYAREWRAMERMFAGDDRPFGF